MSKTTQLKLLAPDGKKRLSDMLDYDGIVALGKTFPGTKANRFIEGFTYSDETIDGINLNRNKLSVIPSEVKRSREIPLDRVIWSIIRKPSIIYI